MISGGRAAEQEDDERGESFLYMRAVLGVWRPEYGYVGLECFRYPVQNIGGSADKVVSVPGGRVHHTVPLEAPG